MSFLWKWLRILSGTNLRDIYLTEFWGISSTLDEGIKSIFYQSFEKTVMWLTRNGTEEERMVWNWKEMINEDILKTNWIAKFSLLRNWIYYDVLRRKTWDSTSLINLLMPPRFPLFSLPPGQAELQPLGQSIVGVSSPHPWPLPFSQAEQHKHRVYCSLYCSQAQIKCHSTG